MALAAPVLTASERRRALWLGVPVYWHLLSLDAPTLTVLWGWALARAAGLHAEGSALAVLGIGTWLIYVADRLLDGRPGAPRVHLRERHYFHARHRKELLGACAAAGVLLVAGIVRMPAAARSEDTIVFCASMVYFAMVHRPMVEAGRGFGRECAVGVLFACATAIPAWSLGQGGHGELLGLGALFAALCCLNCIAIEVWEQGRGSGSGSGARRFPVSVAACIVGGSAASLALTARPEARELCGAALLSALLLWLLDRLQDRTGPEAGWRPSALAMRIAADAALLTPLLLLAPWRG